MVEGDDLDVFTSFVMKGFVCIGGMDKVPVNILCDTAASPSFWRKFCFSASTLVGYDVSVLSFGMEQSFYIMCCHS